MFFNDTATTEIYTLSLPDALPICPGGKKRPRQREGLAGPRFCSDFAPEWGKGLEQIGSAPNQN